MPPRATSEKLLNQVLSGNCLHYLPFLNSPINSKQQISDFTVILAILLLKVLQRNIKQNGK